MTTQRKAPEKAATKLKTEREASPKMLRFVEEYLIDLNATQAALRSGYSPHTAKQIGTENLAKPVIQAAIAEGRKLQQQRTEITADRVVREAWNIVTADARELVQIKVGCCRHCYGDGHKFQRTQSEFDYDFDKWMEQKKSGKTEDDFDEAGGIGFDPLKPADPECPECCGDGRSRIVPSDTRHISAAAAALYAGAKQTKDGIEIKIHDKLAAMDKLFRHLGLYKEDNDQKTDPLTSLLAAITSGNSSTFKPVARDPEHSAGSTTPIARPCISPDDEPG